MAERNETSVERRFDGVDVFEWYEPLTVRVFAISVILGTLLTFVFMKFTFSGFSPNFNVPVSVLAFISLKSWTSVIDMGGLLRKPLTRQETAILQTCLLGFVGVGINGGFGTYLVAMDEKRAMAFPIGRDSKNWIKLEREWIIVFLLMVNFIGLFITIPMAKLLLLEHKLLYPSGLVAAHIINNLHTPPTSPGAVKLVRKQLLVTLESACGSILWSLFKWFFTAGTECGFDPFPAFGLNANKKRFNLTTTPAFIGVGMICPYIISVSMLIGAILSWGLAFPYLQSKAGEWYPPDLDSRNIRGFFGYKMIMSVSMFVGDGVFHICDIMSRKFYDAYIKRKPKGFIVPLQEQRSSPDTELLAQMNHDDRCRARVFLKGSVPMPIAVGGFLFCGTVSVVAIPFIFPQIEPIYVAIAYFLAPVFNFCNSYGAGLSDISFALHYGKFALLIIGGLIGLENGGVLGALVACGVVIPVMSSAVDLMNSLKTGYMTLTAPRSIFIAQIAGTAMGCIICPLVFWVFYSSPDFGNPDLRSPFAMFYRRTAVISTQGMKGLPKNIFKLGISVFLAAFGMNVARKVAKHRKWRAYDYIPVPTAVGIPFYIEPSYILDMCLGTLATFLWKQTNRRSAEMLLLPTVTGFLLGDSLWPLVATALKKVMPPICVRFFPSEAMPMIQARLRKLPLPAKS